MTSLFFKRKSTSPASNQVRSLDLWPMQLREFELHQDFSLEPSEHPEIFVVLEGTVLHEADTKQTLTVGSVVVSYPHMAHHFRQPEAARIVRLRYLPEWISSDLDLILGTPDLLSLFFASVLFEPEEVNKIYVFSLQDDRFSDISHDMKLLLNCLENGNQSEPLLRITSLKLMIQLSEEFGEYWRGKNRLDLRPEIVTAVRSVEGMIYTGQPFRLGDLESTVGMSMDHFGRVFKKSTGMTLMDYAQKRRIFHAARMLLQTSDTSTSISKQLGFTDAAHFTKSFQRYLNRTPNNYREEFAFRLEGKRVSS